MRALTGKWCIYFVRVLRACVDMGIIYVSFYIGYQLYFINVKRIYGLYSPELASSLYYLPLRENHFFTIGFGMALAVFLVFLFLRLYRDDTSILHVREYRMVCVGFVLATLLFLAVYYLSFAYLTETARDKLFSRRIFAYACAISITGIIISRAVFNKIQHYLHNRGIGARRMLIYGAGVTGKLVARRLHDFPAFGMFPVAMVDDNPLLANTEAVFDPATHETLPVVGTGEQLARHITSLRIDELLFAVSSATHETISHVMTTCTELKIPFRFVPNIYQFAIERTQVEDIAGIPMVSMRQRTERVIYLAIKRLFDIVASATALVLLSVPLCIIAGIIRFESRGFPFFIHTRIGLNGAPFKMIKFRTMYTDTAMYAETPHSTDDPRITRVGRWLRRLSIDELPQLINVLRGSMSLVGPRPEMPFIVDNYTDLQRERLKVKPGITGLWQISASRRVSIHENMDYDLYYVHEQSFLLDIVILVQTFFFAFRGI